MHGATIKKYIYMSEDDTASSHKLTSFCSCPTNWPNMRAKLRDWLCNWLATVSGSGRLLSPRVCDTSPTALLIACWALVRTSCSPLPVDGLAVVVRFAASVSRICSNDIPPSVCPPYFFTSNTRSPQLGLRQYVFKFYSMK